MKILLVTEYFPPVNSIASDRPYSLAKYFAQNHSVTVLTVTKNDRIYDLSYERDLSGFELIQIWAGKNSIRSRNRVIWALRAYHKVKHRHFDVVVSTSNPWEVHIVPAFLSRRSEQLIWISDFRDLWSLNHEIFPKTSSLKWYFHTVLEKILIKTATYLTTVSQPLAEELRTIHGDIEISVIYNGYDHLRKQKIKDTSKFRILYTGRIYHGRQNPAPLFQAIQSLILENIIDQDSIEILFYGRHSEYLEQLIEESNVPTDIIKQKGLIARQDAHRMQSEVDLLLFLEWGDVTKQGILTGKLFEYISSGTPILAIGPEGSNSGSQIIKETNTGYTCAENIENIKDAILSVKNVEYKYTPDFGKIATYSREYQASRMEDLILSLGEDHIPLRRTDESMTNS